MKITPLVFAAILFGSLASPAALSNTVPVGADAPAVALPMLPDTSTELALADLRGKVVYVDFWASWCGPCRVSFPILDELRQEFSEQGFEVLAINVDEYKEDALEFMEELPVSYPIVFDPSGTTPSAYGILGMPTGFLVDRSGKVRKVHQGFRKSDAKKIRTEVMELLTE